MSDSLRKFDSMHIDEDCKDLTGTHTNELFYNCVFDKLKGLSLVDCDLNASKFKTSSVKDAIGFAMTLDCMSFRGVEYSPLLFDLFLVLATMTKGNDEKRRKLIEVVGEARYKTIKKVLGATE